MAEGMLSQEEINALLQGTAEVDSELGIPSPLEEIDDMEKDTLGEIANISMGTAATTLSQLLGRKVEITTPTVELMTYEEIRRDYPVPSVICEVKYRMGVEGSNLLILSQRDGSAIVDLMMGGDGTAQTDALNELQISGISEAMNQMMGSAATSMSTIFKSVVDITPPNLMCTDLGTDEETIRSFLPASEPLVRVSFRMVVQDVIDSKLIQVMPINVAKGMVNNLMNAMTGGAAPAAPPAFSPPPPAPDPVFAQPPAPEPVYAPVPPPQNFVSQAPMPVQPAQFAPLQPAQTVVQQDNLNLILDVPLHISVELGRTKKTIKEILEMGPGSVIELERLAGEAVDMIVNGKLIAKCEVIVINETFGIRVTDIVHPMQRVSSLI